MGVLSLDDVEEDSSQAEGRAAFDGWVGDGVVPEEEVDVFGEVADEEVVSAEDFPAEVELVDEVEDELVLLEAGSGEEGPLSLAGVELES